jgi:uncharacterized RDD family membrane protein YckC
MPQPATLFRRLAALLYDCLLLAGIVMISSFAVVAARGAPVPPGSRWFQALVAAQIAAFFIGFWHFGGQTPGMRAWFLTLEMQDGRPVPLACAAKRFPLAVLSVTCAGLGFLWTYRDPQRRAWHDRVVGTRLIRHHPPARHDSAISE